MRLTCPCCGAQVSAEAWQNDATVRQFIGALERLPDRVRDRALPYLGLFRRAGGRDAGASACWSKGLAWPRALRILSDLGDMVGSGSVHWEGGEERPCPPHLWAAALDVVLDRRPKALENNNYLRRVAWELAEKGASQAERDRETQRRQSVRRETQGTEGTEDGQDATPGEERMTKEQWDLLKKYLGQMGNYKENPNTSTTRKE